MTSPLAEQRARRASRQRHAELLDALARRLDQEPSTVAVLQLLVDPESAEPEPAGPAVLLARQVNEQRLAARRRAFREHALTTAQVQELLGGVSRQAVALRVANGGLMSLELGGRSYFPDWQFGDDGVLPGVRQVLALLRRSGRGVLAADVLMRTPLPEEQGRTPAQLLAAGELEQVLHHVGLAGGG